MNELVQEAIPVGFELVPSGLGFTDAIQPCYRRIEGDVLAMGLRVEEHHCNIMGACHGGVLLTLADVAASSGVNVACGRTGGSPTVNLSMDFIAAGRAGQWLEAQISHTSVKRRFGFCSGIISNGDGLVARFNGTFYLPDHEGVWKKKPRAGTLG